MARGALIGGATGWFVYWIGVALFLVRPLLRQPGDTLEWLLVHAFFSITAWEAVLISIGTVMGALLHRYHWRLAAVAGYVGMWSLVLGYLAYAVTYSIPQVPSTDRWASLVLFGAEALGLLLILVFSFYSFDTLGRRQWPRRSDQRPFDAAARPHVAIIVPVYDESLEMVRESLAHLMQQDYPPLAYTVYVADDSSSASKRAELAALCRNLGVGHVTRPTRQGFKAGALNNIIKRLPPDVALVAIVDADYWVGPDFLKATVGYFVDERLSFVQTPQDCRNQDESFLARQYQRADSYFYQAIMPSRNEESAIIFCGTMGVLRRKALDDVDGFDEDHICEDAEISPRLAAKGWTSLYLNRSHGKGLVPATFDAYRKQFHRWAFGNVRILVSHAPMIIRSRLTGRQKFDFLASNLHWFDGLPMLAIAGVLIYLGAAPWFGLDAMTHHQTELAWLALVPVFLTMDGLLRLRATASADQKTTLGHAILVQGFWFSIKVTNLRAALHALMGLRTPFVRTSKESGGRTTRTRAAARALRATATETVLTTLLLATAAASLAALLDGSPSLGQMLLPAWLVLYAAFFFSAPLYAYLSYRTLARPQAGAPPRAASAQRRTPSAAAMHASHMPGPGRIPPALE